MNVLVYFEQIVDEKLVIYRVILHKNSCNIGKQLVDFLETNKSLSIEEMSELYCENLLYDAVIVPNDTEPNSSIKRTYSVSKPKKLQIHADNGVFASKMTLKQFKKYLDKY